MAVPKKGSRVVVVNDVRYRWYVRKEPTYAQAIAQSPMRLAITPDLDEPGRTLLVDLGVTRPDNWLTPHQTSVTPKMVREMIRCALEAGYVPEASRLRSEREATGSPFVLQYPLVRDRA